MTYNNLNKIPPHIRKIFLILIVIVFAPLLIWLIQSISLPFLSAKLTTLKTNEIIASLAVAVAIYGLALKGIGHILAVQYTSKRQIGINVTIQEQYAIITCTIENMGMKRIIPKNVYLFVDQGIEKDNVVNFPYILKHEKGDADCVLGKRCKVGGLQSFPGECLPVEFDRQYHKSFTLKHLSVETILFIDPGEKFSEDLILKLEAGCKYRVTAIWTAVNADCMCANKQFII